MKEDLKFLSDSVFDTVSLIVMFIFIIGAIFGVFYFFKNIAGIPEKYVIITLAVIGGMVALVAGSIESSRRAKLEDKNSDLFK